MNHIKKGIYLAASVIVTAILIVAWHFAVPQLLETESLLNFTKFTSYAILLFGLTWIMDAVMGFAGGPEDAPMEERIRVGQNRRMLAGLIPMLLYSALDHPAVAVLFADGDKTLMLHTPSMLKCALVFVGFCILMQNALRPQNKTPWTLITGVLTYAVGAVMSLISGSFVSDTLEWVPSLIFAVIAVVILVVDAVTSYKQLQGSCVSFIAKQTVFLALISAVMIVRLLTPMNKYISNTVLEFVVSGVINLVIAVVLVVIFALLMKLTGKKKRDEQQNA